ncbi:TPA: GntR family transcriptional regulator [Klebsiella variicola]|nr:GntR family transcriptional regulator [Klebsiella variicola]
MKDGSRPAESQSKYGQIVEVIKQKILSGEWATNFVIPSERELAERFGVNRVTVRRAISMLKQQGYLYSSESKRGTTVLPPASYDAHMLYSFSDDMKRLGGTPGQKILEFGLVPVSEQIRNTLQLPLSQQKILRIKRIRLFDTTPMGIHTSYLALKKDQFFSQEDLESVGSLYLLLEKMFGIIMTEAHEAVGARMPSPKERQFLETGVDEVLLTSSRVTYSTERKPVEYVEMLYPASRYVYRLKVSRDTFSY